MKDRTKDLLLDALIIVVGCTLVLNIAAGVMAMLR